MILHFINNYYDTWKCSMNMDKDLSDHRKTKGQQPEVPGPTPDWWNNYTKTSNEPESKSTCVFEMTLLDQYSLPLPCLAWAVTTHQHQQEHQGYNKMLLCAAQFSYVGISSAMIGSSHNSVHPPEMERNPLKMAHSCPCGGVKKQSCMQSFHPVECIRPCTTAYTGWPPEWSARERYNLLCISQKARAHKCSSFHFWGVWSASRFVTSTIREVQIGKSMIVTVWKTSQPNVWDSLVWDDGDRVWKRSQHKCMRLPCLEWWWQSVWKRSQPNVWDSLVWNGGDRKFEREVSQMYETHLFGMMVTEFQREVSKHMKLTCLGWWWQRVWKRSQPNVWDSLVWDDGWHSSSAEFETQEMHRSRLALSNTHYHKMMWYITLHLHIVLYCYTLP